MKSQRTTGRALKPEEEARLLKCLEEARSPVLATFVKALLLTCARCGELTGMRWGQVDLAQRVMTVGKAKPGSTGTDGTFPGPPEPASKSARAIPVPGPISRCKPTCQD